MRAVVFEMAEWEHEACLRPQPAHEVVRTREPLHEGNAADHADAEVATTFVNSRRGSEVLARLPALKRVESPPPGPLHAPA